MTGMKPMRPNLSPKRRREIAVAVGIEPHYLYELLTDRKFSSPELARKLEEASGGEITRIRLLPKRAPQLWPELFANQQAQAA